MHVGGSGLVDNRTMPSARGAHRLWIALAALVFAPVAFQSPVTAASQSASASRLRHQRHPHKGTRRHRGSGTATAAASQVKQPVWSDEFNGVPGSRPDPKKWNIIYGGGGFGNQELQYYTARSSNVAIDGSGDLSLTARRETFTGKDGVTRKYTSGALQTKGLFAATYGRIEARIKLPAGKGLWPAFWAVGSDVDRVGWPESGEIDIMENLGDDPFALLGSIHGPQAGVSRGYALTTTLRSRESLAEGYHVYGVEWTPGEIVFTLDGIPYSTRTRASLPARATWPFDKPFFLILTLAVGGTWPGAPDASTPFPATMRVDWIRVYPV